MDSFSCDVVPVLVGFVINQQHQAVVESTGTEMMQLSVNDRCQTDTAVVDRSERDNVRYTSEFTLSDMMIVHLLSDQCAALTIPLEHEQVF
jgi:hypothetical protein